MEPIWIAFACGLFIGSCLGFLILGLVSINKDNKLRDELYDMDSRVGDLLAQRQLLKEEIFRLTKKVKPQPRKKYRRPYKKKSN